MRIFSDRQATDLLKELSGEITLLLLPASVEILVALREHLLAAAATFAATSAAADGADRCFVGPSAPLCEGAYFLQPIHPMPPGLTLPPGCPPGGFLMYLSPLPAADGSFPSAAFLPAAALPAAASPPPRRPNARLLLRRTAAVARPLAQPSDHHMYWTPRHRRRRGRRCDLTAPRTAARARATLVLSRAAVPSHLARARCEGTPC